MTIPEPPEPYTSDAVQKSLDRSIELGNRHRAHQEKYDYYLMWLSAAVIGFIVTNTLESKWELPLFFAFLSVLLEIVSIILGIRKQQVKEKMLNIEVDKSNIYIKLASKDINKDNYNKKMNECDKQFPEPNNQSIRCAKYQPWTLMAGIVCFGIWYGVGVYNFNFPPPQSVPEIEKTIKSKVVKPQVTTHDWENQKKSIPPEKQTKNPK